MPALAKSSVGSSSGTTGDDGTKVWPCFCTKKSMNCWRISLAVSMVYRFLVGPACRAGPGVSMSLGAPAGSDMGMPRSRPAGGTCQIGPGVSKSPAAIRLLGVGVDFAQGHAVLTGKAGTVLVLGREHGSHAGPPAELS